MRISDDDLRAIWQERSEAEPADCLTDTAWARLLSSDADAAERRRASTHIASCASCADQYRGLQPLRSWESDVNRLLSPQHTRGGAWWTGWPTSWWWPALAAAAVVILAAQGVMLSRLVAGRRQNARLESQLAENSRRLSAGESSLSTLQEQLRSETAAKEQLDRLQRQRQAELSTPQLDIAIVDLEPRVAEAVRGAGGPQVVTTAANALVVTLVLNFPPLASTATLEIEVQDANRRVLWSNRTERPRDTAALTLALPTAGYPAGDYVIRIFDVTRGRTLLATYPVVIRHTPDRR